MKTPHDSRTEQLRGWPECAAISFGRPKALAEHVVPGYLCLMVGTLLSVTVTLCPLTGSRCWAESPSNNAPQPIKLSSLPKPPEEIAKQLREGNVHLITGKQPTDHVANQRGLDAQTDFEINFNYRCQPQWQHDAVRGTVRIQMNFTRIHWEPKHTIWFRNPPNSNHFWQDALVRHEFDHVRLSADPRMKKQFIQMLRAKRVITPSVETNQVVNRDLVDRLIGEYVTSVFQEITELIDIRYRELDRVTRHGRQPVPPESTIQQWLKPGS
ncbi:MAG: DUF922 domain-containing Zn-dependent protease [Planctomycetaceae bacterium]|nr:DUF922 domain-containing Zn-dependent protease [Planctomycetaceae bacterium]